MNSLSSLSPFLKENKSLHFDDLLEKFKKNNKECIDEFYSLDKKQANLFIKILLDSKNYETLSLILKERKVRDWNFNPLLIYKFLSQKKGAHLSQELGQSLLDDLSEYDSYEGLPIKQSLPTTAKKKLEKYILNRSTVLKERKEDLKAQIVFLKNEKLFKKAKELEKQYSFSYGIKNIKNTIPQDSSPIDSKDYIYSKMIEKNLPKRLLRNESSKNSELFKTEQNKLIELAENLESYFCPNFIHLYIVQIEFLEIQDPHFYERLLKKFHQHLNWEEIANLYLKSENYIEGLGFLDKKKNFILTHTPELSYNFYYLKSLLLLKMGMRHEAELILKQIQEQQRSFRDVQVLLKI